MKKELLDGELGGQSEVAFQANLYTDPNPTRRGLHLARRKWVETEAAAYAQSGRLVVEVGVGCGIFVRFLRECGFQVTAVDINQSFLDNVSEMDGVSVLNFDATNLLPIKPADFILCTEVLEHVPSSRSQAMIDSLFGALKPGGTLLLATPQKFSTVELMARLFKFPALLWIARRIYGAAEELGHINLLTRSGLVKQISKAGFEVRKAETFGMYLPVVAEFGGSGGWALLRWMDARFRRLPGLRGLLWTQAYVLRRPMG
ncbi:class I SAM-dependent methyltransferase [Novosphingobium sp.]|uniref:class I SAM-dependent methyltransferase n=1 Tax=Novosphingobium sp. TaxID=1874826 RepID=UPI002B49B8D3|nr:class I SAM-dependent methyltransferase [Novosphingobium sp.]HKR92893.1 class I SAM-dependent methyltransferase [Novosphingobium sp.]